MRKGGIRAFSNEECEVPRTKALKALMDNETDLDLIFVFSAREERDGLEEKFNELRDKLTKENII